jgi:cytochrome b
MFDSVVVKRLKRFILDSVSHNFSFPAPMKVSMFTVRIWDLPTRLFHWTLALCVIGLVITGNVGGNAMVWHFRLGYTVLTLVLFRLAWGFAGGHWSRWSSLPLHPRHVLAYVQSRSTDRTQAGHNPLGSLSILAMLFFLFFQVSTGLISDDEIANAGPLTTLVSGSWVSWASAWHKNWGKLIIILLVLLHLLALLWHRFKKHPPLLPAMLHGDKSLPEPITSSHDQLRHRLLAILLLALAALAVYGLLSLGR